MVSCLVKYSMGGNRGLVMTVCALIQFAGFNQIGAIVATSRTAKPIGPFALDEIPRTITLCA